MKRFWAVIALSALLTALLPAVGHAAAPYPVRRLQVGGIGPSSSHLLCGSSAATMVHAFTIQAEWNKRVFKNTETALVTITVTRPAPYDPLGLGVPVPAVVPIPVKDANVWTSVQTGRYPFPYGYGQTDDAGQVKFKIPLKLLTKPGPYDASHYASIVTNQGGCPDIEEYGFLREAPGLTIRS